MRISPSTPLTHANGPHRLLLNMRPSSVSLLQLQCAVQPIICFDPLEASASSHVTVHHAAEHEAPAQSRCVISSSVAILRDATPSIHCAKPSEADRRGRARLSQICVHVLPWADRRASNSSPDWLCFASSPLAQTCQTKPPRRFLLSSGPGAVTQRSATHRTGWPRGWNLGADSSQRWSSDSPHLSLFPPFDC